MSQTSQKLWIGIIGKQLNMHANRPSWRKCADSHQGVGMQRAKSLASKDSQIPFIGQNIFVFKVPFVVTLNLCLKIRDTEQKTRTRSDQHGLRKRPKTAEICKKSKIGIFHQFFDVFLAQDNRIEF